MDNKFTKLELLCEIEGRDRDDILHEATYDSVASGICTNQHCEFTAYVEPDQAEGYCSDCSANTVASCLVLAGLI